MCRSFKYDFVVVVVVLNHQGSDKSFNFCASKTKMNFGVSMRNIVSFHMFFLVQSTLCVCLCVLM